VGVKTDSEDVDLEATVTWPDMLLLLYWLFVHLLI